MRLSLACKEMSSTPHATPFTLFSHTSRTNEHVLEPGEQPFWAFLHLYLQTQPPNRTRTIAGQYGHVRNLHRPVYNPGQMVASALTTKGHEFLPFFITLHIVQAQKGSQGQFWPTLQVGKNTP